MSLVARYLESVGIPTVIVASARDIVEECGVPRLLFVDFPLGNPCGKPWDVEMQSDVIGSALNLLDNAWTPRTTVQHPAIWDSEHDAEWRAQYMRVGDDNRRALASAGKTRREAQAARKLP